MSEASSEVKLMKMTEQERELEQQAFLEFQKDDYQACLQTLQKLMRTQESNSRVMHNKAVVEFYLSDMRSYDKFRTAIERLTGLGPEYDTLEITNVSECAAYVNHALLHYHFKRPITALKIMDAVLSHFDKLDDYLLRRAGIFTVHLLLETNQPKKSDMLLRQLQQRLKIRVQEKTRSPSKEGPVLDVESRKDISETQFQEFCKQFRLVMLRSNLVNGKKSVFGAHEGTSEFSILKGHKYFLYNDYQMAAKELSKEFSNEPLTVMKCGEDQNTILANNMGLIHFSVKHFAMAAKFFQQALLYDQSATDNVSTEKIEGSPLHCVSATKRIEILYNHGIALLYLQRPKEAFDCLLVTLNSCHNNPRLWLRLAECCIMVHKQEKAKESMDVVTGVIGNSYHRKYIINPFPKKKISDGDTAVVTPGTTLEYGALCLRNAVTLLEFQEREILKHKSTANRAEGSFDTIYEGVQCNPSLPLRPERFDKLKWSVLTAYSYVLNCLGEYTLAFKYAQQTLAIENLPETYLMLAHLYSAEALNMMDRPVEAFNFLEPKFVNSLKGDDFVIRSSPNWKINSFEAAQSVMFYNLAVTQFLLGDSIRARATMHGCRHPVVLQHLRILKVYTDICTNNISTVKALIKAVTPQFG